MTNQSQIGTNKPVSAHLQKPGHSVRDMNIVLVEKIRSQNPFVRKIRESFYIKGMDTLEPCGMNRKS